MIEAGRGRWKIENEGFNTQKNIIYQIEHLNSRDSNAMKNHYLLTQIADILMQLYLAWNPLLRTAGQTIKNTSQTLLESFRRQNSNARRYSIYHDTHDGVSGMIIQQVGEKWNISGSRQNVKVEIIF